MDLSASIHIPNLMGSTVWFQPDGEKKVQALILHVWPQMGSVPGLNLERVDTGEVHSSVPHTSAVPEATSYYWTLGLTNNEQAIAE